MALLEEARKRADARVNKKIDYDEMNRLWPIQKAALTRAAKTGDPEKVAAVIKDAITKWNEIGAWPDDWALFQRTLDDMVPFDQWVDIRDL